MTAARSDPERQSDDCQQSDRLDHFDDVTGDGALPLHAVKLLAYRLRSQYVQTHPSIRPRSAALASVKRACGTVLAAEALHLPQRAQWGSYELEPIQRNLDTRDGTSLRRTDERQRRTVAVA
jgi:hypothetical protein